MAAIRQRDEQKAAGATAEELTANMEKTLRASWPFTRAWKYCCENCRDTGIAMAVCRAGQRCNGVSTRADSAFQDSGKYRRLCAQEPESDYTHEYGVPCWCSLGNRFEARKPQGEDFAAATKTTQKKFTRFGR